MLFYSEVPHKVTEKARSYMFSVKCLCFHWKMRRDCEPKNRERSMARNASLLGPWRSMAALPGFHHQSSGCRGAMPVGSCRNAGPRALPPVEHSMKGPARHRATMRAAMGRRVTRAMLSKVIPCWTEELLTRHPSASEGKCRKCS